jgi:hypothetical protein
MNKKIYLKNNRPVIFKASRLLFFASFILLMNFLYSCQKDEEIVVSMGEPITLSSSATTLSLSQKQADQTVLSLNWTRGTNHGTGSSIAYTLEIDQAGNDFASAKIYEMGKGVFEKSFTAGNLNDLVLNYWGVTAGVSTTFEAKLMANVIIDGVEDGLSELVTFSVTPYNPVSSVLYMVGSATPKGWDIGNATELTPSITQPWIFDYQGPLSSGSFKFAVSQDGCWCQDFYTMNPDDDSKMIFNSGGSGDDIQWQLEEGGNYKMSVDLLELTITMERLAGPVFTSLYIIGDASPSGWNIGSPEAFTQSAADPFEFSYEANLTPGDFKISTFAGDWCDGQWINATQPDQLLSATDYNVTNGCDGPDHKWHVTEEEQGRYKITVNLYNSTIKIEKVMLYIIGDGGPNGWNIGAPEPMTLENGLYTFVGELGADNATGEFKFSKYKGDWCDGDWIIAATPDQSVTDNSYKIRYGCEGDDNKWRLKEGDAGTYKITFDLDNEIMAITKQ